MKKTVKVLMTLVCMSKTAQDNTIPKAGTPDWWNNTAGAFLKKHIPDYINKDPNRMKLLMETAAHESHMGTYPNPNGFSGGLLQVNKPTLEDIQTSGPGKHPKLGELIDSLTEKGLDVRKWRYESLRDPRKSALIGAFKYMLNPKPIPNTIEGRAQYWKDWYNTQGGKGSVTKYLNDANRILKLKGKQQ